MYALEKASKALEKYPDFKELALLAGNIAFAAKYWYEAKEFYSKAYEAGEARGLVGLNNISKKRSLND